MSKIHSNQSINLLTKREEKVGIEYLKRHSLIIHKQLMMFMKIQKTIIQQRKGEC